MYLSCGPSVMINRDNYDANNIHRAKHAHSLHFSCRRQSCSEYFNITCQISYLSVNAQVTREIVRRIANRVCHNSFSTLFAIVSSITRAICLRRVAYKKNHVTRWPSELWIYVDGPINVLQNKPSFM